MSSGERVAPPVAPSAGLSSRDSSGLMLGVAAGSADGVAVVSSSAGVGDAAGSPRRRQVLREKRQASRCWTCPHRQCPAAREMMLWAQRLLKGLGFGRPRGGRCRRSRARRGVCRFFCRWGRRFSRLGWFSRFRFSGFGGFRQVRGLDRTGIGGLRRHRGLERLRLSGFCGFWNVSRLSGARLDGLWGFGRLRCGAGRLCLSGRRGCRLRRGRLLLRLSWSDHTAAPDRCSGDVHRRGHLLGRRLDIEGPGRGFLVLHLGNWTVRARAVEKSSVLAPGSRGRR